jgi:VWFA-related protein
MLAGVAQLLGVVPAERVMVLRQDLDLHLEARLGSSREVVDAALGRVAASRSGGTPVEAEQLMGDLSLAWQESEELSGARTRGLEAMPGGERSTAGGARGALSGGNDVGPSGGGGGSGSAPGPDACDLFVDRIGGAVDSWVRDRTDRTATTLHHLYQTGVILSGLPGVKTVVYFSDALETEPGAPATAAIGTICPGQSLDFARPDMPQDLLALTRHLNTNQVTIHSLQASGLQMAHSGSAGSRSFSGGIRSSRVSSAFDSAQRTSQRQGMGTLADETGGRLAFNQNDLGGELERIGRELQSYYSLAYVPPPGGSAGEHRIEVALADHSLEARYRRGYREKDADQRMRELLESVLYLGTVENPLEVRLGAGAVRPRGDRFVLPLHAFVPVERLEFAGPQDKPAAELRMSVLARSAASPRQEWQTRAFRILRPPGARGAADLGLELELDRGTHVVAVALRDQASRIVSVVSTTLDVGN